MPLLWLFIPFPCYLVCIFVPEGLLKEYRFNLHLGRLLVIYLSLASLYFGSSNAYQKNIIASKQRWLRRQLAAPLSALNLGVLCHDD